MKSRLLGLAFASADLLLELDREGRVAFAAGAGPARGIDPSSAWKGRSLATLLGNDCLGAVTDMLAAMAPGIRSSPIDVSIDWGDGHVRRARLRAFVLPDLAPAVSCALTWEGPAFSLALPQAPEMRDAAGLVDWVHQVMTGPDGRTDLAFDFIDVPGLAGLDDAHRRAAIRIEAALQVASLDGSGAARLAPERFAVVRPADDARDLAADVRDAAAVEGLSVEVSSAHTALSAGVVPGMALKALRFALEGCIRDGAMSRPDVTFADSLRRTMQEAERFRAMVRNREFQLQYQPIVDLGTRATHHFEALARLGGTTGPAATIQMAEALGLIEGFDLAVAEKALAQMRRPGFGLIKVAVNVSGASLATDDYVSGLMRLTSTAPEMRKRLLVEVTETSAITDMEGADERLRALRRAGIRVCLDDFGVGAASYDYLRRLSADTVKIDGTFIGDIATNERSRTLVSHLVETCAALKMTTIAEMIESEEQAKAVMALKVSHGQGWLFGRPTTEPVIAAGSTAPARRMGEVVGWS
ncbi:EAL domain-containing protein [Brevundimonas sp.]|uniref:EAL domain-containing protein n=1 Tax=Brevundimonas sp. TaxID=1871086 RepID=UPI002ABB74ED|nr:EAL domain-containing protein [Brevundimonas sp.]MDZ4365032.1 EAL domain-containing protein [Brevundimonas sp.]